MDQPVVGWLERPKDKIGLDNLGTQQPCITIYSRLLPGATNVPDRAAYFGFYPWFIRVRSASRHAGEKPAQERPFREEAANASVRTLSGLTR